jgi:hypothetical protein
MAKKLDLFIYTKEEIQFKEKDPLIIERVLNSFYRVDLRNPKLKGMTKKQIVELYNKTFGKEKMKKMYDEEVGQLKSFKPEVKTLEFVTVVKGKYQEGTYYAHEYDQHAVGKGRKLTYSNGFVEYEIRCLNSDLNVLDGIWEEPDNNGCGDRFTAHGRIE